MVYLIKFRFDNKDIFMIWYGMWFFNLIGMIYWFILNCEGGNFVCID